MRGLGVQPHMGVLPESSCEGVGLGSGLSPTSLVSEAPRLWASAWEQGEGCPGQTPQGGLETGSGVMAGLLAHS